MLTQPAASGDISQSEREETSGDDTTLPSDEVSVILSYGKAFLTDLYSRSESMWNLLFWSRIIKLVLIHYLLFEFFLMSP